MLKLFERTYKGNHDFGMNIDAFCLAVECSFDDGAGLHFGDLGICDAETAAAMTEHRVELGELIDLGLYFGKGKSHFLGKLFLSGSLMRYELVQRGIEEADCHSITVHCLEDAFEVCTLHRKKFGKSLAATLFVRRKNHLADSLDTVSLEEHMFRTAETDTLGAEMTCLSGVARCVGICAHESLGVFGGKIHDGAEVTVKFRLGGSHLTFVNVTGGTVERDPVSFMEYLAVHSDSLFFIIHDNLTGTGYTALAHTACHYGCVRCHTAAHCKDTLCHSHTAEVFGRSLDADKNDFLFLIGPFLGVIGLEYDLACGSAG